jgi:hypothetical protein
LVDGLVFLWKNPDMSEPTKKDSTNELPMYDIGEAVKIVAAIHEKALETASLQEVAKGCGYANPTSTPFYRRIVAARLFGFLNAPKAELTKIALDYLKPDTTDAKQSALTQAIMGIKTYADIVNQHIGKKINIELITNRLEKDAALSISKGCARICALTFHGSLIFAGFIMPDGTVAIPLTADVKTPPLPPIDLPPGNGGSGEKPEKGKNETGYYTYTLPLSGGRKITVNAPLDITQPEIERLNKWTKFTLFLDWKEDESLKETK